MKSMKLFLPLILLAVFYGTVFGQALSGTKIKLPEQSPMPATLDELKARFGAENVRQAKAYSAPEEVGAINIC